MLKFLVHDSVFGLLFQGSIPAGHRCRHAGFFCFFFFSTFPFIFISWRLITLQYCSGFCHTLTLISHGFTCVPHPDPLSWMQQSCQRFESS